MDQGSAFIIVALISTFGGLAGIQLLNHNWFLRQKLKLDNTKDLKKLEFRHKKFMKKLGVTVEKAPSTGGIPGISGAGSWLNLLKALDDDTILDIVDNLRGEGYALPEKPVGGGGWIDTLLKVIPEDTIKGIINSAFKKQDQPEKPNIVFED
jgi:hypothetical protein